MGTLPRRQAPNLKPDFQDRIGRVFGDAGRVWLDRLPALLDKCRARWRLSTGQASPHTSLNYLELTSTADGRPVALKVGVPHAELFSEMEALRLYAGRGAVALLDADRELGALLLAQVRPGHRLCDLGAEPQTTRIAAGLMRTLPRPAPATHALPSFADWFRRAIGLTRTTWDPAGLMPRDLLDRAEACFERLSAGADQVVLHGDLHHENILFDAAAGWLAIDPKGVVGPAILECGRYLHNHLPDGARCRRAALVRRAEIIGAALGQPPSAILAVGLVDGVLSHCWCFEDKTLPRDWPRRMALLHLLAELAGAPATGLAEG